MGDIELRIQGQLGAMDLRALSDAANHLDKLLKLLGGIDDRSPVHLTNLRASSAVTTVRTSDRRTQTLTDGVDHLRQNATTPPGWPDSALDELIDVHKVTRREGVKELLLGAAESLLAIDEALAANAEKAKATAVESLGSVTGLLFRYNNKTSPEAGLIDDRTQATVILKFDKELTSKVLHLMDQTVTVRGRLRRDPFSNAVRSVKVRDVDSTRARTGNISVESGIGLLSKDWTGGLTSEDWVRRMRDIG